MCFGLRVTVPNLIMAGMSAPYNLQHYCHFFNVYFSEMQSVLYSHLFLDDFVTRQLCTFRRMSFSLSISRKSTLCIACMNKQGCVILRISSVEFWITFIVMSWFIFAIKKQWITTENECKGMVSWAQKTLKALSLHLSSVKRSAIKAAEVQSYSTKT